MIASSKIIHVNSDNRISGTSESFMFSFNKQAYTQYTHVCLLQCSIPSSYYLVQDNYNTFDLEENASTVTITLEPGNYTNKSFLFRVKELLNANSPNGYTYDITLNNESKQANDGKFYYSVTGNGGIQPKIIVRDYLNEQFGFDVNTTNTFVGDALTSTNVINFIPEQTLYLYSDMVSTGSGNNQNILQELYASNFVPYSCVTFQCPDVMAYSKELKKNDFTQFSISLTNERGQIMNLNGRNMLLTVLMYNKDQVFDLAKRYIKYSLE